MRSRNGDAKLLSECAGSREAWLAAMDQTSRAGLSVRSMEAQQSCRRFSRPGASLVGRRSALRTQQERQHGVSPQKAQELTGHRFRISGCQKPRPLSLAKKFAQRLDARFLPQGIERAHDLGGF